MFIIIIPVFLSYHTTAMDVFVDVSIEIIFSHYVLCIRRRCVNFIPFDETGFKRKYDLIYFTYLHIFILYFYLGQFLNLVGVVK